MDHFHMPRKTACIVSGLITLAIGVLVCLGYNLLYFEYTLPNGSTAQILDILDYVSNSILMPIVSILTCILVGWVLGPNLVIDEVEKTGCKMGRRTLYIVMIRFIAPLMLFILFLQSIGII